jgi:hypothetical protein
LLALHFIETDVTLLLADYDGDGEDDYINPLSKIKLDLF